MLPFYHFYLSNASAFFAVVALVAVANVLAVLGGMYLLHKGCKSGIFSLQKSVKNIAKFYAHTWCVFAFLPQIFDDMCAFFEK